MLDWLPLGVGLAFYAVMAYQHLVDSVTRIYFSSDTAVVGLIAAFSDQYGLRLPMVVGPNNSFTTIAFNFATRDLPGRFVIWQAMPLAATSVGVVAMLLVLRRHVSTMQLVAIGALLLCPNYFAMTTTAAQAVHGPTMVAVTLIASAMTWLSAAPRHRITHRWTAFGLAVVLGPTLASDPALLSWGVAPMLLVAGARWFIRADRESRALLVTSVAATTGTFATGFVTYVVIRISGMQQTNAVIASPLHPRTWLIHASQNFVTCIPIIGLLALLAWLWSRAQPKLDHHDPVRVYGVFWITMMTTTTTSFILTGADAGAKGRYIGVPVMLAAFAVAPVLIDATRPVGRRILSVGAGLSVAFAGFSLYTGTLGLNTLALYNDVPAITEAMTREGVTVGYSAYWTASAVSFRSKGALEIFAVKTCGERLCEFDVNTLHSWYEPRPHTRSFLLFDPLAPSPALTLGNGYELGEPAKRIVVGNVVIAIYDYDIASRIVRRGDTNWSPVS